MDAHTRGAWVIHHGRKVAADSLGAAAYSTLDLAAKAASLLVRLAENEELDLSAEQVSALARVGGLNPKTELAICLEQLQSRRLIDVSGNGSVSVLGITGRRALVHAAGMFNDNGPEAVENAAIELANVASIAPVRAKNAAEYIGDVCRLTNVETHEFLIEACRIGFVDSEGSGEDQLLFNGNLFRREAAEKTNRVLESLSSADQQKMRELQQSIKEEGAVLASRAEEMLGSQLWSKLKAAAVFDLNIVSNEFGEHAFVTSPGAFHKFTSPLVDDTFDHAKALVSALTYGRLLSDVDRGRIWGVELLLKKLIAGQWVGPARAIGNDYRALELERVVQTRPQNGGFSMRLLKREVGEIALQVLREGDAVAVEASLPSVGISGYTPPEVARANFRKSQSDHSRTQTMNLLNAIRGGSQL